MSSALRASFTKDHPDAVSLAAFLDYLREHPIGEILPGVGVIFDDYNGVIPDLVFATHERMRKTVADGRFQAAPDIVIEIISPGSSNERRDRHLKRSLYAARGVSEYWIVDPKKPERGNSSQRPVWRPVVW